MQKETPNVIIIIQARMESTRLPGKVLKHVLEKPLLGYLIERLRKVKNANEIVIATTTKKADDKIVDFCKAQNVQVFRGDEGDVLGRYLDAAQTHHADVIVRVTGDCPLIDPQVIEKVIQYYLDHNYDYVGNTLKLTFPRGMDTEVFSLNALQKASKNAIAAIEREHVTLYIYKHPEQFKLANVPYDSDKSAYRLTVDTNDDFMLIKTILEKFYPSNPSFNLKDIIKLLDENPSLANMNSHIVQKTIKEN